MDGWMEPPPVALRPTAHDLAWSGLRHAAVAIVLVPLLVAGAALSNVSVVGWLLVGVAGVTGCFVMYRFGTLLSQMAKAEKAERAAGYTTLKGSYNKAPDVWLLATADGSVISEPQA